MSGEVRPLRAKVPPRGRQTDRGQPTHPPERARNAPRGVLPTPEEVEYLRKHPSDFYADAAIDALARTLSEADSAKRAEHLAAAQVNATLSMRDATLELAAVMRDIRDGRSKGT